MARRKSPRADDLSALLVARMADCPTAESLHGRVIAPFVAALEEVCAARGYLLNIYGGRANLVVSDPETAETLYQVIDAYLDGAESADEGETAPSAPADAAPDKVIGDG
ncbi:hypothetical protein [Roseospirillum parvum]|uniref:Uncharacterized protein n=1 Tax=Roseospirillum parvum TaxID=83401 RepID=A0A1G7WE36_9PROT|nr:hypothetical protein [Roseospirillum parvum]SDG70208.1 hypothetical protein SAMN05421742_102164 [Roseospirillum parvum]